MSHEAVTWALYKAPSVMGVTGRRDATARQVLVVFAEHADAEGRNSYPGVDLIADATDLSERTVERAIRRLEDAKLLVRDGRTRWNGVRWRLNLELKRVDDGGRERSAMVARQAAADRSRRYRQRQKLKSVTHFASVTLDPEGASVTHSECVTHGGDSGSSGGPASRTQSAYVTHSASVRHALSDGLTTLKNHPGTVPGGTLPPDPLRPPAPAGPGNDLSAAALVGDHHPTRVDQVSGHPRTQVPAREDDPPWFEPPPPEPELAKKPELAKILPFRARSA